MSMLSINQALEELEGLKKVSPRKLNLNYRSKKGSFAENIDIRFKEEDIIAGNDFLQVYFNGIANTISKLPTNPEDISNSKFGYCFPDEKDIGSYKLSYPNRNFFPFINESKESISCWVNSCINKMHNRLDIRDKNPLVFTVRGKIGSGKSTFINYVECCHSNDFIDKNVLVSKIDYSDLDILKLQFLVENENLDEINKHLKKVFEYHLCFSFFQNLDLIELNEEALIESVETAFIGRGKVISDDDIKNNINYIKSISSRLGKYRIRYNIVEFEEKTRTFINECVKSNRMPISAISQYLNLDNWSILFIIDGFDHLRADQVTKDNFSKSCRHIFNYMTNVEKGSYIHNMYCNYLFTFRHCTEDSFISLLMDRSRPLSLEKNDLAPAGDLPLLLRSAEYFLYMHNLDEEYSKNYLNYIHKLYQIAKEALLVGDEDDMSSLFNYNYRKLLSFFESLHIYLFDNIESNFSGEFTSFINYLSSDEFHSLLRQKSYVIREIYLLKEAKSFKNYSIQTADPSLPSIRYAGYVTTERGYLDNIFDYCKNCELITGLNVPPFLIKLRILQFLNGQYRSILEIRLGMERIGYSLEDSVIEDILTGLIYAELIKTATPGGDGIRYSCTGVGDFLINNFMYHLEYIEHTCQFSRLPSALTEHMSYEGKFDQSLNEWIKSSVINTVCMISFIGYCERLEKQFYHKHNESLDIGGVNLEVYDRLKSETISTLKKTLIERSSSNERYFQGSGLMSELNQKIKNIKEQWTRSSGHN